MKNILKACLFALIAVTAGVNANQNHGPQINVYMFGDSTSDPGNMVYEPLPGNQVPVSRDIPVPIFPFSATSLGTLHLRYKNNGIPSDGENFPYFVASNFGFDYILGSQVKSIDPKPGKFINFSLSGATQNSNAYIMFGLISPPSVPNYGSYGWQVQTFAQLVANSNLAIHKNDVFIYYSTGANEVLTQYYGLGPTNAQYIDAFTANIDTLYAMGMRKLVLNLQTSPNAANSPVLQLAAGGDPTQLALMDSQLTLRQSSILQLLSHREGPFSSATESSEQIPLREGSGRWKNLEVQVHNSSETLGALFSLPGAAVGTYPNLNTEADRGFWPVTAATPDPAGSKLPFIDEYHHTQFTDRRLAHIVDWWLLQMSLDY